MPFYDEQANPAARGPRLIDLTTQYEALSAIPAEGKTWGIIEAWCASKGFTTAQLSTLGVRVTLTKKGPDVLLAFPGFGRIEGRRKVTAIKYRNLNTGERHAHPGSRFGEPLVIGDRSSQDWFMAEGETDAARIHHLTAGDVAVMVLPAGALAIQQKWVGVIPRNATVYLAHDADEYGELGATRAKVLVGANALRLKPPAPYKDWSEWVGESADFIRQVSVAKSGKEPRVRTFAELLDQYRSERSGERDPLHLGWGSIDGAIRGISDGQVLGIAARTAVGKTWGLNSIADFFGSTSIGALVASLEMPGTEWAERQLAISEDISPEEVEKWAKDEVVIDTERFVKRMGSVVVCDEAVELGELPLLLNEARDRLRVPLRAVIIDYLGLLGVRGRDAYERTSAIGKGLKALAKSERLVVIVAMQLSRAGGDGSSEVTLEMLRDSGVLEESLDFLVGFWRPGKAKELSPAERRDLTNVMRAAVLKNRKGKEGRVVDLEFRERSRKVVEPV